MCCIEENKKRDFERLYEQEQWEKLKMLLTENAEEVSCLLTPSELRQMMETSGRPQNEDGPMYYYLYLHNCISIICYAILPA